MGFLGQRYNVDDLPEDDRSFDIIPAGWYEVDIVKSEIKPTSDGEGERINVQHKIVGPSHAGRVVFAGINWSLPKSPKAEEIGRMLFGSLIRACGLSDVEDSEEVQGFRVMARVGIRAAQGNYPESNEVKAYRPLSDAPEAEEAPARPAPSRPSPAARSAAPSRPAPARAPAERAAPASSGRKPLPWAKK